MSCEAWVYRNACGLTRGSLSCANVRIHSAGVPSHFGDTRASSGALASPSRQPLLAQLHVQTERIEKAKICKSYASLTQVALRRHVGGNGGRNLRQRGRFFSRRNIDLYRRLADESTGAAKRREILRLLVEEQIRFRSDFRKSAAHASQV